MARLGIVLFLVSTVAVMANAFTDAELLSMCVEKSPGANIHGFVCLEQNALEFLECELEELVAVIQPCPEGLQCTATVGEFTELNPCGEIPVIVVPPPNVTECGNGIVEEGEECEIGGIGCNSDCVCENGFVAKTPAEFNCTPVVIGPVCGNLILEAGEECEVGGTGCSNDCVCETGFIPQTPISINCVPVSVGPICGNGIVETGESCEIGRVGCNAECQCEPGFVAQTPPDFDCVPVTVGPICGNGIVETGESCEVGGLGCSDKCVCESGFVAKAPPAFDCVEVPVVVPECGNGIVETGESCEIGGLGCSAECTCVSGFIAKSPAAFDCVAVVVGPICGNGIIESGESCEVGGLGCSEQCTCVSGFIAKSPAAFDCVAVVVRPVCGNGIIESGESCEVGGLGCSEQCTCVSGFIAQTPAAFDCVAVAVVPACGNGIIESGESCEVGGFGCNSQCQCESGFIAQTPIAFDCVPITAVPFCGNGLLESGESCEVGGVGCSDTCTCEPGFIAQTPLAFDCAIVVVQPLPVCGNGIVEAGESCEIGGVGCSAICTCEPGFIAQTPPLFDCAVVVEVVVPACGNGIVEEGESCEIGGIGCTDQCICDTGFIAQTPPLFDCAISITAPQTLLQLCEFFTATEQDSGFVCLSENATEFLRCHLMELVAFMMPCPAGTRCRAPVDVFTVANPCLWESQSIAAFEGIFTEVTVASSRVQTTTTPESAEVTVLISSELVVQPNASLLCALFGEPGFLCSAVFGVNESERAFIQCGVNGSFAGEQECALGTICAAVNFTQDNPCNFTRGNITCGNGIHDNGEECEPKNNGCNETCHCERPFQPTVPPTGECELNITEICLGAANKTEFFCPHKFNATNSSVFVKCAGENTIILLCPSGLFCSTDDTFSVVNPCKFPAPVCGDGKVEILEQCEQGGVGCSNNCRCETGFQQNSPPTKDCAKIIGQQRPPGANFSELCKNFEIQGFFCAETFSNQTVETNVTNQTFVYCTNGTLAGVFECPAGTTCQADNFTIFNPCLFAPHCGDGIVESASGEECDNGTGCDTNTCKCQIGFSPNDPPAVDCRLSNATKICLSAGLGQEKVKAMCVESIEHQFLICPANGANGAQFALCPSGTTCNLQPQTGIPCS